MRIAPALLVLISLLADTPCQQPKPASSAGAAVKTDQKPDKPDLPEEPAKAGTPDKAAAAGPYVVRRSAAELAAEQAKLPGSKVGLTKFAASCQPRTVRAGGEGTMVVVMALMGSAVMLDPPPVQFTFAAEQGALTVTGKPIFRPAESAGLAPALKGLPAYDNLAIFDVPFAVASDAAEGTQHLELAMRYELLDGQKGMQIGTFTDTIGLDVEIAAAPADPDHPTTGPRQAAGAGDRSAAAPDTATGTTPPTARPAVEAGQLHDPTAKTAPPTAPGDPPLTAPESDYSYLLLAGGGGLLALLTLLAMRRGR